MRHVDAIESLSEIPAARRPLHILLVALLLALAACTAESIVLADLDVFEEDIDAIDDLADRPDCFDTASLSLT
jgi:hypothetical protein